MDSEEQGLEVWGDFACFTRPELKVERFSYPVITPSAVRAVFDAVYWKPTFYWQVRRVELLTTPRFIPLRRNEVKDKASTTELASAAEGRADPPVLWADEASTNSGRTQRQTMALKDVRYRLYAIARPRSGMEHEVPAILQQFRRRASRGQCFYQPYFGCREFACYFRLLQGAPDISPVDYSRELGLMLYDVFDLARPGHHVPSISLFRASVKVGVLNVPDYGTGEVLKNQDVPS